MFARDRDLEKRDRIALQRLQTSCREGFPFIGALAARFLRLQGGKRTVPRFLFLPSHIRSKMIGDDSERHLMKLEMILGDYRWSKEVQIEVRCD